MNSGAYRHWRTPPSYNGLEDVYDLVNVSLRSRPVVNYLKQFQWLQAYGETGDLDMGLHGTVPDFYSCVNGPSFLSLAASRTEVTYTA